MGALEKPEDPEGYRRFRSAGLELHVHGEVLEALEDEGVLRFHFGRFGWCEIRLPRR